MVTEHRVQASARAREALPSPIRKLSPLAEGAKAQGVHVYHLNIGQPDILTPPALMQGIREYAGEILPYAPSHGLPETVDAWREYYANHGIELERDQLLVTTGGSEALLFAMMAVADPGDEILVFEPTYANYFGFARMTNIEVVPVTVSPEQGYHLPSAAEIEVRITPRTRALLYTSPGNPTGTVYSYDEIERLAGIAERHGLFLIADETYREIVFEGDRSMSALKLKHAAEYTIVVDSVSKRFSATGARIGCIASRNAAVMDGVLRFAQARLSAPTVEQVAIVSRPEGAFYILAVLPIDDGERFASWLLSDFRHDGETLMVSPGDGFYVTPGLGKQEIRFAFVLEEKALERAMTILGKAVEVYPGRTR
jgi:aspartate aminotransferase